MNDNLPTILAEFTSKGYVIAPAGYGKTHLIALAVKEAKHKQLILTHTFAGVNSIKTKMANLGVPSANYQIDTIASWSLRLALSYPKTSKWTKENPESKEWNNLYQACCTLLGKNFIRHTVCCTYSGIYVDEYQDCSELQHSLISKLAEFLPCRILGDHLQAIFDFADKPVNWESDIYPHFQKLGELKIPHRWYNANAHELGDWLNKARQSLLNGETINLNGELPKGVSKISVDLDDYTNRKRFNLFYKFLNDDSSVIAIYAGDGQSKNKSHILAKNLAGKFSSIEEVEGKTLFDLLKKYQKEEDVNKRFLLMLNFAKKCFTRVGEILTAGTKKGVIAKKTKATKYPDILDTANNYLNNPTSQNLKSFFQLIKDNTETHLYRRDLFNRFLHILTIHIEKNELTLLESANIYQQEFRHSGRPLRHNKLIGTTLLVKGLEYDHAIILNTDSLDLKQLYVAMTRGAKSLTIITNKDTISF